MNRQFLIDFSSNTTSLTSFFSLIVNNKKKILRLRFNIEIFDCPSYILPGAYSVPT